MFGFGTIRAERTNVYNQPWLQLQFDWFDSEQPSSRQTNSCWNGSGRRAASVCVCVYLAVLLDLQICFVSFDCSRDYYCLVGRLCVRCARAFARNMDVGIRIKVGEEQEQEAVNGSLCGAG